MLKLDVQGQGDGKMFDVDGQAGWGVLKIRQFLWTSYVYRPKLKKEFCRSVYVLMEMKLLDAKFMKIKFKLFCSFSSVNVCRIIEFIKIIQSALILLMQQLKKDYQQNQTPYLLLLTTSLILIVSEKSLPLLPIIFSSVLTVGFEVIRKQEKPLASSLCE